jgi:hypothetical protein
MPGKLVTLVPSVTPQDFFAANKEWLGITPDGTGLQILCEIDNEYYVLAGPRTQKVLTVHGGKVEHSDAPFSNQLVEEFNEETYGVIQLAHNQDGFQLVIKGHDAPHQLTMQDDLSFVVYKPGKYAYATFTAVCKSLTLEQLNQLATTLTPTANFWNQFGNYLFPHTKAAPKDAGFADYWQGQAPARQALIERMTKTYHELTEANTLLMDPLTVFGEDSIEKALDHLNQVASYAELESLFKDTAGRYSERSGYHVFRATELLRAAKDNSQGVQDITGANVAVGIFNDDAVKETLPLALARLAAAHEVQQQAPVSISPRSALFKAAPVAVTAPSKEATAEKQAVFN